MIKAEKVEFVNKLRTEMKSYKTVAVMPMEKVPDRLVQKVRNELRPKAKFVIARKSLVMRALEGDERLKQLEQYIPSDFALILTNMDPTELNKIIAANRTKLGAKPNQLSPEDIHIESGETTIAPGQAVTDLKTAGIDVQIQKGKVVISKSKVLVAKGAKITTAVSKALKMLDIMPFETGTRLNAVMHDRILFTERVLAITEASLRTDIAASFSQADALALSIGFVTPFNVSGLVRKAYMSALGLGLDAEIYEPEISEKLLAKAMRAAMELKGMVKEEPKAPEPAAQPAT
ncbi:MAG: 50S ribosomal protein L10 [Candidatus Micrarchaeota archaeon]|nr:50S ribosomal protein L10 [Candidatus Micrarchaeota archaeon]